MRTAKKRARTRTRRTRKMVVGRKRTRTAKTKTRNRIVWWNTRTRKRIGSFPRKNTPWNGRMKAFDTSFCPPSLILESCSGISFKMGDGGNCRIDTIREGGDDKKRKTSTRWKMSRRMRTERLMTTGEVQGRIFIM